MIIWRPMRSKISITLFAIIVLFRCQSDQRNSTERSSLYLKLEAKDHGINFLNQVSLDDSINIINYLYAYNGGGVAGGDLNNDGLPELFFTSNSGENKLYLNKSNLQFEDITTNAGIKKRKDWYTGVTLADVNADGWLDIYLCKVGNHLSLQGHNELYINQGNLTFRESAAEYGLDIKGYSTQAAFIDYDLDGDMDMYLLCHAVHNPDSYQDTSMRYKRHELAGDKLLRNEGNRFIDVSVQAGIYGSALGFGLGVNIGDINKDGWPDIYVSNDFHENDYLYLNKGDGTFREVSYTLPYHSQFSMGNGLGDLDDNGWTDIITLDMRPMSEYLRKTAPEPDALDIFRFKLGFGFYYQYPRNMIQLNQGLDPQGLPWFKEVAQMHGLDATDWSWSVVLTDANTDGLKDVVISNGIMRRPNDLDYLNYTYQDKLKSLNDRELAELMPKGDVPNQVFIQSEGFTFTRDSLGSANCVTGLIALDLDADGDEDLVGNTVNDPVWLMENTYKEKPHHLKVDIKSSISLDIEIKYDQQAHYYKSGPKWSFQSMVHEPVNIGLNETKFIDTLRINRGHQVLKELFHIPVDTFLTFAIDPAILKGEIKFSPRIQSSQIKIPDLSIKHEENLYQDETVEPFIPYYLSQSGPHLAVADVNQDGYQDLYVGATQSQSGILALQSADGRFIKQTITAEGSKKKREETGVIWADVDGDEDLDLVTAAGASEQNNTLDQTVRLYLNDKRGAIKFCKACIPPFPINAAVVRAGDFDADGDLDLFVGGKSKPGQYGVSPFSLVYVNRGDGNFELGDTTFIRPFGQLGMVTDAQFVNLDGDQADELIVVGHWMPITWFDFQAGKIVAHIIKDSEGWWNCLTPTDVDNDGDMDFLAGNWGLNSQLKADTSEPLQLYVADFDQNGFGDPIMTYFQNGIEYSVLGKETLQKHLPVLKKTFTDYSSFAKASFRQYFPGGWPARMITKKVVELRSGLLVNKGEQAFVFQPFDHLVQSGPVYAIEQISMKDQKVFIVAGNNYSTQPYLGRLNNLHAQGILIDGSGAMKSVELPNSFLSGEVRALNQLDYQGKKILIVGSIDKPLAFYDIAYFHKN